METRVPGTTTRGNGKLPAVETWIITTSCPGSPMAKSRDGIPKAARSCFIASSVASTVTIGRDAFGARQSPWKTSMSVCPLPQPLELPAIEKPPRLLRLLPRLESLRPLDARELARLRIPGDEARDEEA